MLTASYEDPEQLTHSKASRSPALLTDLPGTEQKTEKQKKKKIPSAYQPHKIKTKLDDSLIRTQ